jgi:hypothetical protein
VSGKFDRSALMAVQALENPRRDVIANIARRVHLGKARLLLLFTGLRSACVP